MNKHNVLYERKSIFRDLLTHALDKNHKQLCWSLKYMGDIRKIYDQTLNQDQPVLKGSTAIFEDEKVQEACIEFMSKLIEEIRCNGSKNLLFEAMIYYSAQNGNEKLKQLIDEYLERLENKNEMVCN